MSLYGVTLEKEKALKLRMKQLNLNEADLVEKFICASGKGGQKINTSSVCVYLKHLPSGIEVKVADERSQALNRYKARRRLVEKYELDVLKLKTPHSEKLKKIKKQKQRRKRRSTQSKPIAG